MVMRTTTCFAVVVVLLGAGLAAQDKPDFSGTWKLESPFGPDNPQTLSVTQSLVRTNVRGEPMNPFFKDITITRALASGTRSDTHQIGVVGGTYSLRADGVAVPRTDQRVAWEGQVLVIESRTGLAAASDWAERREAWALDSTGRLRLTITTRSSVDAPKTAILVYRRK